jgi:glycosyltransferase involved in cell wall biosynthesis
MGKTWDTDYGKVPDNYHIIESIPDYLDFDLVLAHTDCERLRYVHKHLSGVSDLTSNRTGVPILRHNHVLPDIRYDIETQKQAAVNPVVDFYSFISKYSRDSWGFTKNNSLVIEHGIDTGFWSKGAENDSREQYCLSVVNELPSRDWCCGYSLWREINNSTPCQVVGKSTGANTGFSQPAHCIEHLRDLYQTAAVYLNTSIHSPVPTSLMEAMACGCPIVSTETCMIPEIIQHGVNGFMSNNPEELKKYCNLLLNNPIVARKMGMNGKRAIEEKYSLERFIKNWNSSLDLAIKLYRG